MVSAVNAPAGCVLTTMRRVYLDTSHLARLASAAQNDLERFVEFVGAWQEQRCELVIAFPHLIELRRHRDQRVRRSRYQLVSLLLPCTTDVPLKMPTSWRPIQFRGREILRALLARGVLQTTTSSAEQARFYTDIFVADYTSADQMRGLQELESAELDRVLDMMQVALNLGADASAWQPGDTPRDAKLSEFPEEPIPPAQIAETIANIEREMAKHDIGALLKGLLSPEEAARATELGLESVRSTLRRAGEVGLRRAYLEMLGLNVQGRRIKRVDQAVRESGFSRQVRETLTEHVSPGTVDVEAAVALLTLGDCPGYWLSEMVEREIRFAEPTPAASNAFDLLHVHYYPYVDVFFTDKRMAEYINRVRERSSDARLTSKVPAVAVPDTIDAIQRALALRNDTA